MGLIKTLIFLIKSEHPHFLSVDFEMYSKWKFLINLAVRLNRHYKSCEIYRRKYKILQNFVVVGLRYNGKNVKRRTSGYARDFVQSNRKAKCLYCETDLSFENATADHIVPISNGGNNCQVNLIVCCNTCNAERGNIDFMKYLCLKNRKYAGRKRVFI